MANSSKNVLGICGSPKTSGVSTSEFLLSEALKGAQELGAETKLVRLNDYNIVPCDGCGDCMNKKQCHLFKDPNDQYIQLYKEIKWADAFIFSSPVYALGLPYTWKMWIDRCEPVDEKDLQYQYYNYEVAADVKGKAFQGKVAGQIVTSGGIGQEYAMASLMPLWTNVKLSVVISVGISMIEFDEQPGIRQKPWGQGVSNAQFAIDIARNVGRRVTSAIGFSTFNVHGTSPRLNNNQDSRNISNELCKLVDLEGCSFNISSLDDSQMPLVLVLSGPQKSAEARKRLFEIKKHILGIDARLVACVDQLPHFITKEFVVSQISDTNLDLEVLIDWDRQFFLALGLSDNVEPITLVINSHGILLKSVVGTFTSRDTATEVAEVIKKVPHSI